MKTTTTTKDARITYIKTVAVENLIQTRSLITKVALLSEDQDEIFNANQTLIAIEKAIYLLQGVWYAYNRLLL